MQCSPVLPASQAGPSKVRPRLGYRFDPVPAFVPALVRARQLCASDVVVLGHLLRFRPRDKPSCWSCKRVVAGAIGVTARTVQSSFDRLSAAKVIEQRHVGYPDPEDPKNRTGWRVVFLWMAPEGYVPGPGPARVGKGVKKGSYSRQGGEAPSPPPPLLGEKKTSPGGGEENFSQLRGRASEFQMESETDRKEKIPSSSSLRASDDDDDEPIFVSPPGENPGGTVEAPPQAESGTVAEAVEAVRECYGDEGKELAEEVQGDAEPLGNQIGGDWLAFITAVFLGHRALNGKLPDKGTRYFVKTATGYRDNGGIPTTAARAYRKKLRDRREKEAEAQARQAEQAELARKQAAQHAVWRAEAEKKRAEKERQEQEDRIKRCLEYDAIVLPIRAEYDALTADELQPYRESAMATLTELFRLQNSQVVREQILKERMYARFLAKKGVQLPPMPVGYVPPAQRTGVLWMAPCPRREQSPARPEPAQGNI